MMHRQQGISLLELMLTLVLLGVLLFTVMRYVKVTQSSQKVTDGVSVLQALMNAGEGWVWSHKSYEGISLENLLKIGLIPEGLSNPWGGEILVFSNHPEQVNFVLTAVPDQNCQELKRVMTQKQVTGECDSANQTYQGIYPNE